MTPPDDTSDPDGWAGLDAALDARADAMTPAERAIAAYLRDHRALIPYETGAAIAAAVGVSEMSVIRFIRSLGYANLKGLKEELRPRTEADARAIDDVMARFRPQSDDHAHLHRSLELELEAIARAYDQATTPRWGHIVGRLIAAERIHVAGFQASQGLAMDFATRLKWVRPSVHFAEGRAGVFSEVLESDPAGRLPRPDRYRLLRAEGDLVGAQGAGGRAADGDRQRSLQQLALRVHRRRAGRAYLDRHILGFAGEPDDRPEPARQFDRGAARRDGHSSVRKTRRVGGPLRRV